MVKEDSLDFTFKIELGEDNSLIKDGKIVFFVDHLVSLVSATYFMFLSIQVAEPGFSSGAIKEDRTALVAHFDLCVDG